MSCKRETIPENLKRTLNIPFRKWYKPMTFDLIFILKGGTEIPSILYNTDEVKLISDFLWIKRKDGSLESYKYSDVYKILTREPDSLRELIYTSC